MPTVRPAQVETLALFDVVDPGRMPTPDPVLFAQVPDRRTGTASLFSADGLAALAPVAVLDVEVVAEPAPWDADTQAEHDRLWTEWCRLVDRADAIECAAAEARRLGAPSPDLDRRADKAWFRATRADWALRDFIRANTPATDRRRTKAAR